MEGNDGTEPQTAASVEREAMVAREGAADQRARVADERERTAGDREATANRRERKADEREAFADAREREADRREAAATEREQALSGREQALAEHGRALGAAVEGLEQRMLETIERSRALLELGAQRLDRQEAGVRRTRAHRDRQEAEVFRATAETERKLADWMPEPSSLAERGKVLRKRAHLAIQAFASNEDQAARLYQELAASHPERRDEYLNQAEHARTSARSAREVLRKFTD